MVWLYLMSLLWCFVGGFGCLRVGLDLVAGVSFVLVRLLIFVGFGVLV